MRASGLNVNSFRLSVPYSPSGWVTALTWQWEAPIGNTEARGQGGVPPYRTDLSPLRREQARGLCMLDDHYHSAMPPAPTDAILDNFHISQKMVFFFLPLFIHLKLGQRGGVNPLPTHANPCGACCGVGHTLTACPRLAALLGSVSRSPSLALASLEHRSSPTACSFWAHVCASVCACTCVCVASNAVFL